MKVRRWAVSLDGEAFDLEDAREAFRTGPIQIAEMLVANRQVTALTADEFDACEDAAAVNETAQRLVALINGYLFARDASRKPLQVDAVYGRGTDGEWGGGAKFFSAIIEGGSRARARGYAVLVQADGTTFYPEPQVPPEIEWLSRTFDDTAIDVLHMLRGAPDWFDLYMAFERMRDDVNKRFPDKTRKERSSVVGWPDTEHFRRSAQVYRHSRVKWEGYSPQIAMHLREARPFVAQLVRLWLQWRARTSPESWEQDWE